MATRVLIKQVLLTLLIMDTLCVQIGHATYSPTDQFIIRDNFLFEKLRTVYINQDRLKASRRFTPKSLFTILNMENMAIRLIKDRCDQLKSELNEATQENPFRYYGSLPNATWDETKAICEKKQLQMVEIRTTIQQNQLMTIMHETKMHSIAAGIYDKLKGAEEMLYVSDHKSARLNSIFKTPCGPNSWSWEDWRDAYNTNHWSYTMVDNGLRVCRDLELDHAIPVFCQIQSTQDAKIDKMYEKYMDCTNQAQTFETEHVQQLTLFKSLLPPTAFQADSKWFQQDDRLMAALELDLFPTDINDTDITYPLRRSQSEPNLHRDIRSTDDSAIKGAGPTINTLLLSLKEIQAENNGNSHRKRQKRGNTASYTITTQVQPIPKYNKQIKAYRKNKAKSYHQQRMYNRDPHRLNDQSNPWTTMANVLNRNKRNFDPIAIFGTIGSITNTVSDIFTKYQLGDTVRQLKKANRTLHQKFGPIDFQHEALQSEVQEQASRMSRAHDAFQVTLNTAESEIASIKLNDVFTTLAAKANNALTALTLTIQTAIKGEVPNSLLTIGGLTITAQEIMKDLNLKLTLNPNLISADLTYDEASYWITFSIPIEDISRKATIYKIHPLPIYEDRYMYEPMPECRFFAASTQGNTFAPLDPIQTSKCLLSTTCPISTPMSNHAMATCGIAEFYGSHGDCRSTKKPSENIYLSFNNETFYYVQNQTKLMAECGNLQRSGWDKIFQIMGIGTIISSPSCRLETENGLLITPSTDVLLSKPTQTIDKMVYIFKQNKHRITELTAGFHHLTEPEIHPTVEKLIMQEHREDDHVHNRSLIMAIVNSSLVLFALIIIIIIIYYLLKHRRQIIPILKDLFSKLDIPLSTTEKQQDEEQMFQKLPLTRKQKRKMAADFTKKQKFHNEFMPIASNDSISKVDSTRDSSDDEQVQIQEHEEVDSKHYHVHPNARVRRDVPFIPSMTDFGTPRPPYNHSIISADD